MAALELLQPGYTAALYPRDGSTPVAMRVIGSPKVKRSFKVKYDSCTLTVDNGNGGRVPDVQDRLEVYENGILVFHGLVVSVPNFSQGTAGLTASIAAASMPYLLWKKLSRKWTFVGQDDIEVLQSLMLEVHNNEYVFSGSLGNVFQAQGDVEFNAGRLQLRHATASTFASPGFAVAVADEVVSDINKATVQATQYAQRTRQRDLLFNAAGTSSSTPWVAGESDYNEPPSSIAHDVPESRVRVPDRREAQIEEFNDAGVLDSGTNVVIVDGALKLSGTTVDEGFEEGFSRFVNDAWRGEAYFDSVAVGASTTVSLPTAVLHDDDTILVFFTALVGAVPRKWWFTYSIAARTFSATGAITSRERGCAFRYDGQTYALTGDSDNTDPTVYKFTGVHPNVVAATSSDVGVGGLLNDPVVTWMRNVFTYAGQLFLFSTLSGTSPTFWVYDSVAASWSVATGLPFATGQFGPSGAGAGIHANEYGALVGEGEIFDGVTWRPIKTPGDFTESQAPAQHLGRFSAVGINFKIQCSDPQTITMRRSTTDLGAQGAGQGAKSLHVTAAVTQSPLANGDFEDWPGAAASYPPSWQAFTSGPVGLPTRDATEKRFGAQSAKLTGESSFASTGTTGGRVGFWAKSSTGSNGGFRWGQWDGGATYGETAIADVPAEWTFYDFPVNGTLLVFRNLSVSEVFWIDAVGLEGSEFAVSASAPSTTGTLITQLYPVANAAFTVADGAYKFRLNVLTLEWRDAAGTWTPFTTLLGAAQWSELKFEVNDTSLDVADWRCRVFIRGVDQGQITPHDPLSDGLLATVMAGAYYDGLEDYWLDGIVAWPTIGPSNPLEGQATMDSTTTASNIQRAYLEASANQPGGSKVAYEVSADDGNTWYPITLTTNEEEPNWVYFTAGSSTLAKVRITLTALNIANLPSVMEYRLVLQAGYLTDAILNGDFEAYTTTPGAPESWTTTGGVLTKETSTIRSAPNSLKVTGADGSGAKQAIPAVTTGQLLEAFSYARTNGNATAKGVLRIWNVTDGVAADEDEGTAASTGWERLRVSALAVAGKTYEVRVATAVGSVAGDAVYFDDVGPSQDFIMQSKDFGDDDTVGASIRIEEEGDGTETSTPANTAMTYRVSSNGGLNWSAHPGPGNTVVIPPAERGTDIRVEATLDTDDAEVTPYINALRVTWMDAAAATTLTVSISRDGGLNFHVVALDAQFDFSPYPDESPKNAWVVRFDLSTTDPSTSPTIEDVTYRLVMGSLPFIKLGKIGVQVRAVLVDPETYPAALKFQPLGPAIERLVRDVGATAFWVLNPATKTYTLHYNSLQEPSATFTGRVGVEVLEVDGRIDGQDVADRWAFGGGT